MASKPLVRVQLVYSPTAREVVELALPLQAGCTALQALILSGLPDQYPQLRENTPSLGIWGRRCEPDTVLHDGDRLEVYRALTVDPKVARRERFNRQGARATGLFAKRRPGAKAGY